MARRVLGHVHELTLKIRFGYAQTLYKLDDTLDDLREAVTMLEEIERIARRVLGGTNPTVGSIVRALQAAREMLSERESPNA